MRVRTLVRWIFSGLSAIFLIVLYANIEKLLAIRGWDMFLVSEPTARVDWIASLAVRPSAHLLGAVVIGFTLGLWLDPLMSRFDGRLPVRRGKWKALGQDAMELGSDARACRTAYNGNNATEVFAAIQSMAIRLRKDYFPFPVFPSNATTNHRLWITERYLIAVGKLIADGHINEARAIANNLAASLPSAPYSDDM